ncbi:class II aldolase/adducin family protein [Streptomyces hokutonensis]|uniref:class II aldolase/adducin family protein n=1 Tax=Streptomyces hokutonensis TaxID=1306990 RepID=UPI0036C120D6
MKPICISEDAEMQRSRLSAAGRSLSRRGWMPGTFGSLSLRSGEAVMITAEGQSRRTLSRRDTVMVDPFDGLPLSGETEWPPAEILLHLAIYRQVHDCRAVVHAHPPHATALATLTGRAGFLGRAVFPELELAKALGASDPHLLAIPVFANLPEVSRIADELTAHLKEAATDAPPALLIDRHGVVTWGRDLDEARNRLECLEELSHLTLLTGAFAHGAVTGNVR